MGKWHKRSPKSLSSKEPLPSEVDKRIRALRRQSRKGSWGLAVFVLLSILAIFAYNVLPALPEKARQILGAPPKTEWISMALALYVFSALTLTLARIIQGSETYRGWSHVLYISAFYFFYAVAGGGRESFWAVFVSGLLIFGLENYAIRTRINEMIEEEKERLARRGGSPE